MDRHGGKSPPFLDREKLVKFLNDLLKGTLKCNISPSAVDELKDLSGLWDFGNTQKLIEQPQHFLDRDQYRKLNRNVEAVISLWTHKDYLEKSLLFYPSDVREVLEKQPPQKLPFPDAECSLAVAYQTLEAIAHLPAPGNHSSEPPDFATQRLGRDRFRTLIRNVKAVLIELRTHKEYLNEALPFHGPGPTPSDVGTNSSKPRDKHLTKNLPFSNPECSLAVTYQTLGAIAGLPAPGSTKPPNFATPRDGLIVALGAWWRKHVRREPSAENKDAPFMRLCRYIMTDERLSTTVVKEALKNTRGRGAKFDALHGEAAFWELDPF